MENVRWSDRSKAVEKAVAYVKEGTDPNTALSIIVNQQEFCTGTILTERQRLRFLSEIRIIVESKQKKVLTKPRLRVTEVKEKPKQSIWDDVVYLDVW